MKPEIWNQIKNTTAGELARALERDGWLRDKSRGPALVYWSKGKRVSIHFHPGKTYGIKQLRALTKDIGWTEEDLRRLKLIK